MAIVDLAGRAVGQPPNRACPLWSHPATDGSLICGNCQQARKICIFWLPQIGKCAIIFVALKINQAVGKSSAEEEKPE